MFRLNAQVPSGAPVPFAGKWYQFQQYLEADSSILFTSRDTGFHPIKPALNYWSNGGGAFWYWNMVKWQRISSTAGFVLYSDSTTLYTTITRLRDSLAHYVTLGTPQTITAFAPKIWNADQTFNDTMNVNNPILITAPSHTQSVFSSIDSLKYISSDGAFIFKSKISGLNDSKTLSKSLNPLMVVRQRLFLNKVQDSLMLNSVAGATFNPIVAFLKKNNADDTVKVTSLTGSNPFLKSISTGLEETTDTALISDRTTYWKISLPIALNYSYTSVTNHGRIDRVTDYDIGNTYYLNGGSSDSANGITRHEGIFIENLAGNPINLSGIALYQNGRNDSVILKSQAIQTPNVVTTGTVAYKLLMDANGNWIEKAYLPTVSATLNFPSTGASAVADLTVTVTGAVNGDPVFIGVPNSAMTATASYFGWVSAPDTVTIRFSPKATEDPPSATFKVQVQPQ